MSSTCIVWLRRDFRLHDNAALSHAICKHDKVLPVYIYSPEEELSWKPGEASNWWLHYSLNSFIHSLKQYETRLVLRKGNCLHQLKGLCKELKIASVYWNRLYEPAAIKRDKQIKSQLRAHGIDAQSFKGSLLQEPWEGLKDNGEPYKVFTPFSKQYFRPGFLTEDFPPPKQINSIDNISDSIKLEELKLKPDVNWDKNFFNCWQPGEAGAKNKLEQFLSHVLYNYKNTRDIPSMEGISRLSPHLHFGEITPKTIWNSIIQFAGTEQKEIDVNAYLRQLVWRDFAHHLLFYYPHTTDKPFRESFNEFPWNENSQQLDAWCQGKTGIPIVDAGMRELWSTGWMHNRVRMLVASFLTKNCLIHWQYGAKWFWDTLLDADLANNSMGWQWTAGCGVDAAPYFRIFNPVRQGERFDSNGAYVRQWLPELSNLPNKYIHQPWMLPGSLAAELNFKPGKSYAVPIVDLSETRKTALEKYRSLARL